MSFPLSYDSNEGIEIEYETYHIENTSELNNILNDENIYQTDNKYDYKQTEPRHDVFQSIGNTHSYSVQTRNENGPERSNLTTGYKRNHKDYSPEIKTMHRHTEYHHKHQNSRHKTWDLSSKHRGEKMQMSPKIPPKDTNASILGDMMSNENTKVDKEVFQTRPTDYLTDNRLVNFKPLSIFYL